MLFSNAQQQMYSNQAPQQMNMHIPVQQSINQVGYYGGRNGPTRGKAS